MRFLFFTLLLVFFSCHSKNTESTKDLVIIFDKNQKLFTIVEGEEVEIQSEISIVDDFDSVYFDRLVDSFHEGNTGKLIIKYLQRNQRQVGCLLLVKVEEGTRIKFRTKTSEEVIRSGIFYINLKGELIKFSRHDDSFIDILMSSDPGPPTR